MIAQMVGAGALVALLLGSSHVTYQAAVSGVGVLMIVYVVSWSGRSFSACLCSRISGGA